MSIQPKQYGRMGMSTTAAGKTCNKSIIPEAEAACDAAAAAYLERRE